MLLGGRYQIPAIAQAKRNYTDIFNLQTIQHVFSLILLLGCQKELTMPFLIPLVIRASVPKLDLDDAFEQKNDIAKAVEEELEKAMSAYGYEIVQTLIVDIEPDEHVKRAMNEINAGIYTIGYGVL